MARRLILSVLLPLASAGLALAQTPLGTPFTYQGRLADGGVPASGTYEFQFMLFDAAVAGAQVGPTVTKTGVPVGGGLFTVSLDFGTAFNGSKRWLEIGARPGGSPNPFTILSPRQELTPSPNAVFSSTAPWTGVTGKPAGFADDIDNDSGGDVTGVTAGTGLAGGGTSGNVTLSADTAVVQSRVSGACAAGSSIRVINNDGSVTCEADDDTTGADWSLTGNAGTNPGENFIGTTDNQAFELRVNNLRGLRIEPPGTTGSYEAPNVFLGYAGNSVGAGIQGAVVAGGGSVLGTPYPNRVTYHFGVVGGGWGNLAGDLGATVAGGTGSTASGVYATVGGGFGNVASDLSATIGGGYGNAAAGSVSTVGGGESNLASGRHATVGGGASNHASAQAATVPGGVENEAGGIFSFAAGIRAKVRNATQSGDFNGDEGTFVWADSTGTDFTSTGPNQFLIRAGGGVGINTNAPATALDVNGTARMSGFRLTTAPTPGHVLTSDATGNGTWQPPAAGGGDITGVTAGTGLTGGGVSGTVTLNVSFAGSGTFDSAARADHDHFLQTWSGAQGFGRGLTVINTGSGGFTDGIWGQSDAPGGGRGVVGYATSATGSNHGVWGQSDSGEGRGVFGLASAGSGVNYGVYGQTNSPSGYAGYFAGRVAADSLVVSNFVTVGAFLRLQPSSGSQPSCSSTADVGTLYFDADTDDLCVCRNDAGSFTFFGLFSGTAASCN